MNKDVFDAKDQATRDDNKGNVNAEAFDTFDNNIVTAARRRGADRGRCGG